MIPLKPFTTRLMSCMVMLAISCLMITSVSATTITSPSDHIERGDTVTIAIQDLNDNATFTLRITGTFSVTPGGDFSFEANNFFMPFSLQTSQIQASMQNTDKNVFDVLKGETEVKRTGRSTGGSYTTVATYTISRGTYDYMKLGGTALPDANLVIVNLEMTGTKKGPNDGTISFVVEGIDSGTVDVTAAVDGSTVLSKQITVGTTPVPTTEVPVTSVPATHVVYGSTGGLGGTSGGSSGGSVSPGSVIQTDSPTVSVNNSQSPASENHNDTVTITPVMTPVPPVTSSVMITDIRTTGPVETSKPPTKTAMTILPLSGVLITGVLLYFSRKK